MHFWREKARVQNPNFHNAEAAGYASTMLKNSSNLLPHQKAIYQRYAGSITQQQLDSMLDNWSSQGYRYYDEADGIEMRDATTQRYNLSVSSANDRNSFVGTIAYHRAGTKGVYHHHQPRQLVKHYF